MSRLRNAFFPARPDSLLWRRSRVPTTTLYFLNSCGDLVSDKVGEGCIQQVGANSFRTPRTNLIIRQDLPEVVGAALDDRTRRLVYLLDDNVGAFASDAGLPPSYRQRLGERWRRTFRPLLRRADAIVVCSGYLMHHLHDFGATIRMDPVWNGRLLAGLENRLSTPASQERIQIAYLGTVSHQEELAFLVPVLARLLQTRNDFDVTLPAGNQWPDFIMNHARVKLRWPVPWSEYESRLATERFDICLYPSLDTPFAGGRSANKLTEQALTGAFGLFSATWPHADRVLQTGAGALVSNRIEEWGAGVCKTIEGMPAWRAGGQRIARELKALNDPAPQRELWRHLLAMENDG